MASVDKDKAPSLSLPPWQRSWELIKGLSGGFRAQALELGYGIKAPAPPEPPKDEKDKKEPEKKPEEGDKDKKKEEESGKKKAP